MSAIIVLLLLIGILSSLENVSSQAEERLDRVMAVVAEKGFPKERRARNFVHFYTMPDHPHIDVTDLSTADWEQVHDLPQNQPWLKAIDVVDPSTLDWEQVPDPSQNQQWLKAILWSKSTLDWEQVPDPSQNQQWLKAILWNKPWLDTIFVDEETSYGIATTPHEADVIHFLAPSRQLGALPDFRLWFAQDSAKGLYILAHIKNADLASRVRLRLTVHQSSLEDPVSEKIFVIRHEEKKTGRLSVAPQQETIEGKWWEKGRDQFFELVLKEMRHLDALELAAETLQGNNVSHRIGTRAPLPLNEEIGTYTLTKHLALLTSHYEVYRRESGTMYWLSGTRERASEPASTAVAGWLLTAVSRIYFYFSGIEPCPTYEPGALGDCFLDTGGMPPRLRLGRALPEDAKVIVFTEERFIVSLWGPGLGVLASAVLGLLGLLIHTDRVRRRVFIDLEHTTEDLRSYANTCLHQAEKRLRSVKNRAHALAISADKAGRTAQYDKINELVSEINRRLRDSVNKMRYEQIVRDKITEHGQNEFDLAESISDRVESWRDDGEKRLKFQNIPQDASRPVLPGTADKRDTNVPNSYFIEALEPIVENALEYGDPQSSVTICLEVEHGRRWLRFGHRASQAVLRVRNYGSTVPEDKLRSVFELGTRYVGATGDEATEGVPANKKDHLGLGLYLTSQIVRAYGGICRMDNFHDSGGEGVVVTVRLPVRLKAGLAPSS